MSTSKSSSSSSAHPAAQVWRKVARHRKWGWGEREVLKEKGEDYKLRVHPSQQAPPEAHGTLLSVMWQSEWEASLGENTQLLIHVRLFVTPCTVAHQAPLSMEFSKKEYWSG